MAFFVHAVVPGVTAEQYDQLDTALQETPGVFDGCVAHACVSTDDGPEVFDIREAEQQMNAFVEKMMPIATEHGWPETGVTPRVMRVHHHWVPGGAGRPPPSGRLRAGAAPFHVPSHGSREENREDLDR
ncbi:hypothetical protein [Streptomyces sp. NPDC088757]|uniref:hypothetical protein n=1 Tax=Streptomyces sp. NPDC088757 TaxID=3365889 RepID=UPI003800A494